MTANPKRGEIWLVQLDPTWGQEIQKTRPAIVISSEMFSSIPMRIIVPVATWQPKFQNRPFMILIQRNEENSLVGEKAISTDTNENHPCYACSSTAIQFPAILKKNC